MNKSSELPFSNLLLEGFNILFSNSVISLEPKQTNFLILVIVFFNKQLSKFNRVF